MKLGMAIDHKLACRSIWNILRVKSYKHWNGANLSGAGSKRRNKSLKYPQISLYSCKHIKESRSHKLFQIYLNTALRDNTVLGIVSQLFCALFGLVSFPSSTLHQLGFTHIPLRYLTFVTHYLWLPVSTIFALPTDLLQWNAGADLSK